MWKAGDAAGDESVFSATSPPEGGFLLDCASCKALVRAAEGSARTVNHARAVFDGDQLVLFEATPWVELERTQALPGGEAAAKAEAELTGSGFAPAGLEPRWVTLEGDQLLYELTPTRQTNVTSVFADAFTGKVIRISGQPSALITNPTTPSPPNQVQESEKSPQGRDVLGQGVAGLVAALGAGVMILGRRKGPPS